MNDLNRFFGKYLGTAFCAGVVGFASVGAAHAALIARDGFGGAAGSSLTASTGPLGFSSAYTTTTTSSMVSSPGFAYGDLPVSGNKVDFLGTNNATGVLTNSPETPGTTVFLSYLMRVDPTTGSAGVSLFNGTTETLFTGKRAGSPNVLGIEPKVGTAANSTAISSHLSLVVYRIDFAAAGATIKMYVNPQSNVEPATPDLVVSRTSALTYDRIRIHSSGATGSVDELRLGETFADVAPVTYGTLAREVVVLGSSVAAGAGASPLSQAWAYRLENLLENQAPVVPGSRIGWQVENASVSGDNTQRVLNRFQTDVATARTDANLVIIALSLANEGLEGSSDPQGISDSFKNGLTQIVSRCRAEGFYPIISLVYPNGAYTANEYAYVKRMNVLLNTWDVPSINTLGSIDDGSGHWAAGNFADPGHPNSTGHGEMFHAIVPSLFDAISAGKIASPQWEGTRGYLRLQQDAGQASPIRFTPSQAMLSFNFSFRVRSTDVGTIAAVGAGATRATLEIRDNSLVYIGPGGPELSVPMDANDGGWHDIALSHRHATGKSLLYIDGLLKGSVDDQYVPDLFVVGGAAGAAGRALAPLQADYQDVAIHRAAWTEEEARAQSRGALQQASLEIGAPLADPVPVQGAALENRAQSLSQIILQTAAVSPEIAATAPDALNAVYAGGTTVNLTWLDHDNGASVFTVERRRTGVAEAWSTVGTSPGNSPAFTDNTVLAGVSYDYRVSISEGTLHGDYSNVVSVLVAVVNTDLYWDSNADTTTATGGSGTWNLGSSLWRNTTATGALQTYNNTSPSNITAQLGGTLGTLTLAAGTTININKVAIATTGYTVAGGAGSVLNLSGAAPAIVGSGTTYFTNKITGTSGLSLSGGTFTVFAGDLSGLSGTVNVVGRMNLQGTTFAGGNGAFAMTGSQFQEWNVTNILTANNHGSPTTIQLGALLGISSTAEVRGGNENIAPSATGDDIFQVGALNTSTSYAGIIKDFTAGVAITGLTKVGSGTLTLSGTNNSYTGGTLVSAGILNVTGSLTGATAGISTNGTGIATNGTGILTLGSTGIISGAKTFTQGSSGTSVLAGTITHSGATTITGGALTITGTSGAGTIGAINLTGASGTLNIGSTGTLKAASLSQGTAATDAGVVNHTAGTLTIAGDIALGNAGGYGAYTMTGGTLNVASLRTGSIAGGGNGSGYILQTGGTINVSSITTLNRLGTGTSVLNIAGSTALYNQTAGNFNPGFTAGGTGIVTVSAGLLAVTNDISFRNNNSNGILNLNGGITQTRSLVATGGTSGDAVVNLNGGILKANADNPTFMNGIPAAYVCSGGARIDSNGKTITIGQPLLTSAGTMGVAGVSLTSGGSGYLAPPVVTISGGGGKGASAIAVLTNGAVSSIAITSSGTGYTSPPALTLTGGGPTTAAIPGPVVIETNPADGGLTKEGLGTLILSGANTYSGNTTVNAGTLNLASTGRLPFLVTNTGATGLAGSGAVVLDGAFNINTSAVSVASGTWTLVDTSTLSSCTYGAGFSPGADWQKTNNVWTLVAGPKTWTFTQATGKLSLITASYSSWIDGFFQGVTDPAIVGAGADPDSDGIANSVEMVIGGNPSGGDDTALLPSFELVVDPADVAPGDYFLFTFRKTDLSVISAVASVCEYATDLAGPWTTAQDGVDGVEILVDDNYASFVPATSDTDRFRVYIPKGANPRLFARLNARR